MLSPPSAPPSPLLQPAAAGRQRAELMVAESAVVLRRFYFLERTLIRLQAGWLPGVEDWAGKLLLPELLWMDGLVARMLRERIQELRYPERRITPEADRALIAFLGSFADAPSDLAFLMALARVLKPYVRHLFADYSTRADPLDDAPSRHGLSHAIHDLDDQIARLERVVADYAGRRPELAESAERWTESVGRALRRVPAGHFYQKDMPDPPPFDQAEAGGLPFAIRRRGVRDRRFTRLRFAWPDRHTPQPPGAGRQLQVRQAVHHLNEVWAAEMAAACLYDLLEQAPLEFLEDASRWCFDEIRHCRMGYERLKEWGFTEAEMPLDAFSYDAGELADPLVRLGIIFFFETTYIHTKPERAAIFGREGDRMSSHDMDFDWADELIHTHYGKKWLEHFLSLESTPRKPNDIKRLAEQAVIALQQSATPEDQAETQAVFERMMAKARTRFP